MISLGIHLCQERRYRVGDGAWGSPGQVMTGAFD
jgi:hypothetical protein